MAELAPRPRNRLLRTYGPVGGRGPRGRAARAGAQWFAPQDSKRFFSSTSSSNASSDDPSPSVASEDSDDPDFCCEVGRRRRRPGGRVSKARPSLTMTPRRLRLRARPPRKCSTPCSPLGPPPPFPGGSPGRLSPDLSVCSQPSDGGQLGTSASLFSPPASPGPGPGSPAPGDSVIGTGPSVSLDATSLDQAPGSCSQEAATGRGRLTRLARQARSSLTPALFSLMDSGNPEDSEFGTGAKDRRESYCERELMGKRLENPGLSRMRKKRVTDKVSCQETGAPGAVQTEYEASGCKLRKRPGKTYRPERTGPSQKRKHQEAVETSLLPYNPFKKGQRMGKDSFLAQDLTQLQNDCSWTKARASFSFHKKKIVTAVSDVCNSATTSSPSGSFISEYPNSPVLNKTSSAPSPWHSSSMYLLTPLKTPRVADQKASDAEKVYRECNQEGPIPFSSCLSTERLECCEKIGEGVFGEVFQTVDDCAPVALKIIAIEGPDLVNGAQQKTFEEILPEIIISKELSLLSDAVCHRTEGFIGLNSVHCVRGPYPPLLLRAWDHYHSTKGSANDRPDFFGRDQLFIILEFEFGGIDLEQRKKTLSSIATAKSILHQITASLAVAEASLHFEHRDLHWGNVLLKKTSLKEVHYTLSGKTGAIPTCGLQVNIIDYTLSRLERDGVVVFCDISMDEGLFTGEGDYQFEIYRLMKRENNNCWGEYHPYSNVLWLHYLTDKILKEMVFKKKCNTTALKQIKKNIEHFHQTMLNFSSATDLLCQHSLFNQ
ncbi:serine/threonine-protein kinase haspin isoform X2 [Pipistrellus kuhlii]|uniref:serine/threonine-protein kinase haspin isoform X2 n=1 Tax=Pipistrellus kuhlii TaxID=59472 RepID=UPI00174F3051|nr:serine/threonine-protein kinase haspin isoform X2 [Pipistrellus kuhlii]